MKLWNLKIHIKEKKKSVHRKKIYTYTSRILVHIHYMVLDRNFNYMYIVIIINLNCFNSLFIYFYTKNILLLVECINPTLWDKGSTNKAFYRIMSIMSFTLIIKQIGTWNFEENETLEWMKMQRRFPFLYYK